MAAHGCWGTACPPMAAATGIARRHTRLADCAAMRAPTPPPSPSPLSSDLLVGDAAVLVTYFLSLSTARAFALAATEATAQSFDLAADLRGFSCAVATATSCGGIDLLTTVRFITSEQFSAAGLAAAWCLGGSLAGATRADWVHLDEEVHSSAPFGVARLVRGWAVALPVAFVTKALIVAAVYMPAGGSVVFDLPTACGDLGGMLAVLVLWRRWLLGQTF